MTKYLKILKSETKEQKNVKRDILSKGVTFEKWIDGWMDGWRQKSAEA